jgi:glycosyltransferase involved in cell wall biosynthesis
MPSLVFVLEQTLGHVAHTRNIERALAAEPAIDATVIKLAYREAGGLRRLPGLRTWTVTASLDARAALTRRLAERPADAVFVHTQVAALLAGGVMRRVPTVVSLDATPVNFDAEGAAYGHRRGAQPLEAVKRRLNRLALSGAAALVTWCRWAADSLVADYGVPRERVRVIPPGVDQSLFRPAEGGPAGGPARVLFVGGHFERKGGHELLEAMRRLGGRAELDVVTGSEVPDAPAGVTVRVHRGLAPQSPALVALYRAADVFALPSRGDCLPQAVAEAAACGLPVVASAVGAIPEMVTDGVTGRLVPPRDARALGEALESLLDPARRAGLGAASLAAARRGHDAARNNRAIFDLMRDLAERRQPALGAA